MRSGAPIPCRCRSLPAALRDRRGATSLLVAAMGSIVLGLAAMAAEGGAWYSVLRNASTAADLGAVAGASARDRGALAVPVALDTAARNGFRPGTGVTVNAYNPPISGPSTGNSAAVEVVITRTPTLFLASTFLGTAPVIRSRAVAVSSADQNVCVLSLNQMSMGGSSLTTGQRCVVASGDAGISITGSAGLRAAGLITTGTCTGCTSGDVWTDNTRTVRPFVTAGRDNPVVDPYSNLQRWRPTPPACRSAVPSGRNMSISPSEGAICGSLSVGVNDTLTLAPGIYYFKDADLDLKGRITGTGVTLVFTGSPSTVGTIKMDAQATGSLTGPSTSLVPGFPEAGGMIIYRDAAATNRGPTKEAQINGGSSMSLRGGMYLPTSDVVINGTSASGSDCLTIVGYNLTFTGNAGVSVGGCANLTAFPTMRTVRLLE